MSLSLSAIQAIIEAGDLAKFLGEFESQHLDAKGQPYVFTTGDHVRRELAKDVVAFANAEGGCLVIGAETAVSNVRSGEQISGLKPFPDDLFIPDQIDKLIGEWIYPTPRNVIIRWYPDVSDPTRGTGVIFVPSQDARDRPFLITRSIGEKKTTETMIGYAERHLDRTDIKKVAEIHHALHVGMNLEMTLLDRIGSLEVLVQRLLDAKPLAPKSDLIPAAVTAERTRRALSGGPFSE